jgi:phosphoenolpyruvate synthase/pyruvate phosphate dikinase
MPTLPDEAKAARNFGAKGIGLCRTEHMFFEGDRIKAVREMILAEDEAGRRGHWPSCCRCSAVTSKACSAR